MPSEVSVMATVSQHRRLGCILRCNEAAYWETIDRFEISFSFTLVPFEVSMRFSLPSFAISVVALQPILAADLTTIERLLNKEPRYESKQPGYCLLVFGPEAKTRVWLVVDDTFVYLDRNGNNDLTEPGERIPVFTIRQLDGTRAAFEEYRVYRLGDVQDSSGGGTYNQLILRQLRCPTANFIANTPEEREAKATLTNFPTLAGGNVSVVANRYRQNAGPPFGRNPSQAPIVHFGGPLTICIDDEFLRNPVLRRGNRFERMIQIRLGTPGVGKVSFAFCDHDLVPKSIHPIVEGRFAHSVPGKPPIETRFPLKDRC
jgi:hypothetical protein